MLSSVLCPTTTPFVLCSTVPAPAADNSRLPLVRLDLVNLKMARDELMLVDHIGRALLNLFPSEKVRALGSARALAANSSAGIDGVHHLHQPRVASLSP